MKRADAGWTFGLVLALAIGIAPATLQAATSLDRDAFFGCLELKNYELDADQKGVHPKGKSPLTDSMQTAIGELIDVWQAQGDTDLGRLAYILATARRESMSTFRPVREAPSCGADEQCRERAIGRLLEKRALKSGKPVPPNYALPDSNGQRYYGRGYIQVTFKKNYERAGDKLGIDLVNNPDKVLDVEVASKLLVRAMLEGWYGSRRPLSYYIDGEKQNWIRARDNVNPGSPNKPITAAYATDIYGCLNKAAGIAS